jgi:hypothetical protein
MVYFALLMPRVIFVFIIGIATGYFVAGLSDAGIAPQPSGFEDEPNAVTENPRVSEEVDTDATMETLSDPRIGLRLQYRTEPNGYAARSVPVNAEGDAAFVKGYQFMLKSDAEYMESGHAIEGPPTIDVRVYKNSDRLAPRVWATQHPLLSNIELARSDIEESTVNGENAVQYLVDGLYLIETAIITRGTMVYVVTGAYATEDNATYLDFEAFLNSIEFI